MAGAFFAGLLNGAIRRPDAVINGMGPLPVLPSGASQFSTPDGRINASGMSLLDGMMERPYAYGTSARISTQTQQAHPNRVQLIIPKLYIPSPESDGQDQRDPVLQHAVSDGDLIFTFHMGTHTKGYGPQYVQAQYGFAAKATPVINLATANYILWGLQVGMEGPKATRWVEFFKSMTRSAMHRSGAKRRRWDETSVWNFVQTYLRPFAIQHGGDQQGGMHESDGSSIVTHGAVDYVASMMIEGKARHVNNLWTSYDVHENDDLVLALRKKTPPHGEIPCVLSSSVRSTRNERVHVGNEGFYYLRPEILQFRSFSDVPYIHIGRSQKYCSAFQRSADSCAFDARAPVIPGAPLQLTFEPMFVDSEPIFYKRMELGDEDDDDPESTAEAERPTTASAAARADAPEDAPPPHALPAAPHTDARFLETDEHSKARPVKGNKRQKTGSEGGGAQTVASSLLMP